MDAYNGTERKLQFGLSDGSTRDLTIKIPKELTLVRNLGFQVKECLQDQADQAEICLLL